MRVTCRNWRTEFPRVAAINVSHCVLLISVAIRGNKLIEIDRSINCRQLAATRVNLERSRVDRVVDDIAAALWTEHTVIGSLI